MTGILTDRPLRVKSRLPIAAWGVVLGVGLLAGLATALASSNGLPTAPQPDAWLYHQYARQFAAGEPYLFYSGAERSTGLTSHLYHWFAALCHAGGMTGDLAGLGGFLGGLVWHFAIVTLVWGILRRVEPRAADVGAVLTAFGGQTLLVCQSQIDMGMHVSLVLGLIAAVVWSRPLPMVVCAALLPWCRPEGIAICAALALVALAFRAFPARRGSVVAGAVGVLSGAGVFGFNFALTGRAQFDSLARGGLLDDAPLSGLVHRSMDSAATVWESAFGGLSLSTTALVALPVLAVAFCGAFALSASASKRARPVLAWLFVSAMATVGAACLSGYPAQSFFRLASWIVALVPAAAVVGIRRLADSPRIGLSPRPAMALLAGFQILSAAWFLGVLHQSAATVESRLDFARRTGGSFPRGARFAANGGTGMAYVLDGRRMLGLSGVTSPELAGGVLHAVERMQHDPFKRYDMLFADAASENSRTNAIMTDGRMAAMLPVYGEGAALSLLRADWSRLDAAAPPRDPAVAVLLAGMTLRDSVDVAYPDDEVRSHLRVFGVPKGTRYLPAIARGDAGGTAIADVGRYAPEGIEFDAKVAPGEDAVLVARIATSALFARYAGAANPTLFDEFEIDTPAVLPVRVNGAYAGVLRFERNDSDIAEAALRIAGETLNGETVRVRIGGEHYALQTWVWQ